jgi:hypothetical protein
MSIHAQLSPEAAAKLRVQKRNSTISSLMISLLVLVLMGLLLFLWAIPMLNLSQPDIVSYRAAMSEDDSIETKELNTAIQRKPSAPSSSMAKVIAANTTSPTAIPVPDFDVPVPSSDFGSGDDFGAGWGTSADGGGGGFGNIPADMRKRCSPEDRKQRLDENGGNQACEDAVMASLRYLKKNQATNGSWGNGKPVAMTGLSILAFLGHCETPLSVEFGDTVTKGMTYLVDNNRRQGGKSSSDLQDRHWCYEHAIAMYALAESYTFCKQLGIEDSVPGLRASVEEGINWIIDNQTREGGWDYDYNTNNDRPGDTSIVAWHMQALKAAKATGLSFSKIGQVIGNGLDFLERTQSDEGGFGYGLDQRPAGGTGHFTLAGAGTLCFQQHKGASNSNARNGVDYIEENSSFSFGGGDANLYEHYYSSQAMINNGGAAWEKYNQMFRDELLEAQNKDGSFPLQGSMLRRQDIVYSTALATLMLEVYYRFLPGTGGE